MPLDICLLEPYGTGSHQEWAVELARYSRHRVEVLKLNGNFWKWRMHGGAVTLAKKFMKSDVKPDLILATDMLDLTTFLALTRDRTATVPIAVYFHENQITYPWSPRDRDILANRDKHYGFINYTTALAADAVFFNSRFHHDSFLDELPRLLKSYPDHREIATAHRIRKKSAVLHLGLDLKALDTVPPAPRRKRPLILWNHRWEHDKDPEAFFKALFQLAAHGLDFEVAVLGKNFSQSPDIFNQARRQLGARVVQFGYAKDFSDYIMWLRQADILPVTSRQEFFGASVVQAVYCGCFPLLPRRLSYPELIPPDRFPDCFYQNTVESLVENLARLLNNMETVRNQDLKPLIRIYGWDQMTPRYDAAFEKVVHDALAGKK